ncbi:MAG: glycosyl hydrolase [Acidobacteriota bacterium]
MLRPPLRLIAVCLLGLTLLPISALAKKGDEAKKADDEAASVLQAGTFAGLTFRELGPATTSGRIADLAVHPEDPDTIYVAAASGGVWKTTNHGNTWTPIFDDQGSYSIGVVVLDPKNPNIVWVGTGENNSQRSVGYGDGVYKSLDGGKSWKHVGLKDSEHIGKIVIHPDDSNTVFVAAQGPLWSAGGDRGLYVTRDGGESWEKILDISEHTGVSELVLDPRDSDTMIAVAYQRRRHVWTLINGGPEAGLHKTTDGGKTWRKLSSGLPSGDVGRIGLAWAEADPEIVYAIVEAPEKGRGFYRSTDRGETWSKRSGYSSGSGQYYQEIFVDPHDADRVYSMDVWMQVTENGGASWSPIGERSKHVDNHALWINPDNPHHLLAGCDGGLYETWDRGANWKYFGNLPLTQFYRLAVSNDAPFFYVYGGTQDNFTLGGPSATTNVHGIANSDWFVTHGGDGFQPQIDPTNPDIVYSQSQYGNLVRYDRASGEEIDIQPQPGADGPPLVWNWDSALAISPHDPKRLYFAADRIFRTDDRGDTWTEISDDLTRQIDRNTLPVMGKVWPIGAVAKNVSTSIYGNIVTLSESPLVADLLYAGTDDGLVQISEDGGANWRAVESESIAGIPERAYVNRVRASQHDADTVFVAFNHHKMGDFKPYLAKSTDRGKTWTSIAGDLPERGSVYAVEQDPERAELLYVGTEFGVFATLDGGDQWIQLTGGLPTIAVRDLVVHERDAALVLGTFGRGFWVLDDLTPLRQASEELLSKDFVTFPSPTALAYHPSFPLGLRGKSFQGDDYYLAENPPFGAVITYYVKDSLKTLKQDRKKREKEQGKDGGAVDYPSWDALRAEQAEKKPAILFTIRDAAGEVVRRLQGPASKGFHQIVWDLRYPPADPVSLTPPDTSNPFAGVPQGPMAMPGTYQAIPTPVNSQVTDTAAWSLEPVTIEVESLGLATLPAADRAEALAFQQRVATLWRAVQGAMSALGEADDRFALVERAILETPGADLAWREDAAAIEATLRELRMAFQGDRVVRRAQEPIVPGIGRRVQRIVGGQWGVSAAPTNTQRDAYRIAGEQFGPVLERLRQLVERDLPTLEAKLEAAGAAWTPGRVPTWSME